MVTKNNLLTGICIGLVVISLFFSSPAKAASIYYVSTSGNDSNPGTLALPWLTIQHAANTMGSGNTAIIQSGTYPEEININSSGITFQANGKVVTEAITIYGNSNTVRGFTITDPTSDPGIFVRGGNYNLIEGNEIYHTHQDGIWFFGDNNTFRGNYIHNILDPSNPTTHTDCFQTWAWAWNVTNNLFEKNICYNDAKENSGQVFMINNGARSDYPAVTISDITIRNNIFVMINSPTWALVNLDGADASHPISNVAVENNTMYNATTNVTVGVGADNVNGITVANNSFINMGSAPAYQGYVVVIPDYGDTGIDIHNNAVFNTNGVTPYYKYVYPNDIYMVNPQVKNLTGYDFHLLSTSPLIDEGSTLNDVVDGFDGNARPQGAGYDIGAFEFQSSQQPTATQTNLPSYTPTFTPTKTTTSTFTSTPTYTPTKTTTSTFTNTPTYTPTKTTTSTFTRTPTYTPTKTTTSTFTSTPTYTPTKTKTSTFTSTPTYTPTKTKTSTFTSTPTYTPTKITTSTFTSTPTYTPTGTTTSTFTGTPTSKPTSTTTSTFTSTPTYPPTSTLTPTSPSSQNPGYFVKYSPPKRATGRSTAPNLTWLTSTMATSYEYCITTSNLGTCDTGWVSTGSVLNAPLSGLAGNTIYYWQVRAWNDNGSTLANGGTWWTFTTSNCFTLTTNVIPDGSGSVGVDLQPNCAGGKYASGTVLHLTATANSDNKFSKWSGNAKGSTNPLKVTMGKNKTITANFKAIVGLTTMGGSPIEFSKLLPTTRSTWNMVNLEFNLGALTDMSNYLYCYVTKNNTNCDTFWTAISQTGATINNLGTG